MHETVIGLEVHLHLKTRSKAFCGCPTEFGQPPNTQTCPVCLGMPGSLPLLNLAALEYAIKTALALSCSIQEFTKFDRKHYYYPDLPKNYQISQYDLPFSKNGFLDIKAAEKTKRIRINRVHFEEDAGKLVHQEGRSLVDYNRAGMPLLEIVSEPDINSAQEAYEYLALLKSTIEYLDVSDCDMEKGSLRCDANISLRPEGSKELGVKAELKNMNSFKAVREALSFEVERQSGLLAQGEKVAQETRLWDEKTKKTVSMRSKEEAKDYRYFPDPDLPPFIIKAEKVDEIKKTLPELPWAKQARFMREYAVSEHDAKILVLSKRDSGFAEECIRAYAQENKKPLVNWLIGPLLSEANARNCGIADLKVSPQALKELVDFFENGQISNLAAKSVLSGMVESGGSAAIIIKEKNLAQISDAAGLQAHVEEAIAENAKSAQAYKEGKSNALMFLVGQVMKKTQGKANPKIVQEILKRRLG